MFDGNGKSLEDYSDGVRVATDTSPDQAYSNLRHMALSVNRVDAGIPTPMPDAPVWGILMETGYSEVTATLLALSDGTTSIYFSNGGGIIGGHAHDTVRRATTSFMAAANQVRKHMNPAKSFPIPTTGHTVFYALLDSMVLTASALEKDLGEGNHELSELFYAGHEVITQLRLIDEAKDTEAAN